MPPKTPQARSSEWRPTQATPRDAPLLEACKARRLADAVKAAEDPSADVDTVDELGYNALMYCAFNPKFEAAAAALVERGAKLNVLSKSGGTSALVFACERGHAATALLLVQKGAKLDFRNVGGKTALDYADEKGLADVAAAIRKKGGKTGAEVGPAK